MNSCDRVESLLSAYQENETSPAETRYVAGHLTACKRCRTASRDLEVLLRRLQLIPKVKVSEGFTERVLDDALGRKPAGLDEPLIPSVHTFRSTWSVPLQAAAVLVLAAFLGMQWWAGRSTDLPLAQSPLREAIETADRVELVQSEVVPQTTSLSERNPQFQGLEAIPTSIGFAGEELALDDWTLTTPQGGGQPILTRVGSASGNKVVVTY